MIQSNTVLIQIEKLLQQAQQSPNEANLREQLTAIRALCDVVLHTNETTQLPKAKFSNEKQVVIPTSEKKSEVDANGDSIFDF